MNYTGQTSFADMFEYYCARNVTNEREYNEREMLRWLKQQLAEAHRAAEESAKDAHKRGWEQCLMEVIEKLKYQHNLLVGEASLDYLATLEQCWNTIASMEYKEDK